MKRLLTTAAMALLLAGPIACSKTKNALEIQTGTDVTLEKRDGIKVTGRLVEVLPEHITVESRDGARTVVRRADITALRTTTIEPSDPQAGATKSEVGSTRTAPGTESARRPIENADRASSSREVTVPAGTLLPVELRTAVSSDGNKLEDPVRGRLKKPVTVKGVQALPAGSVIHGHVTAAERSARVKGRAFVAIRFTAIEPSDDQRMAIRTDTVTRLAPATKKADAVKIGGGAAAGAVIGGILGGGDGAAKGATIGGAAGTGAVLSTRGKEVRLAPGSDVSVRLAVPLTVRVREG